ncbi:hypothetical protein [Silvibacterium bohemicum]|nr:hypothetical protein [Silvibacterium bohemicum]
MSSGSILGRRDVDEQVYFARKMPGTFVISFVKFCRPLRTSSLLESARARSQMSTDIITGVRQAVQDFVAPEIRQLRGDISALDTRIFAFEKVMEARFSEMNAKYDARFSELNGRFGEANARFNEMNTSSMKRIPSSTPS